MAGSFQGVPSQVVMARLKVPVRLALAEACEWLAGKIKRDINKGNRTGETPSKPGEPPRKRTARLFKSIVKLVEDEDDRTIVGYVGTNVKYARHLEYGFDTFVTVRPHTRTGKKGKRKGKTWNVTGHFRRMRMYPRPFLRPALLIHRKQFQQVFDRALDRRLRGR